VTFSNHELVLIIPRLVSKLLVGLDNPGEDSLDLTPMSNPTCRSVSPLLSSEIVELLILRLLVIIIEWVVNLSFDTLGTIGRSLVDGYGVGCGDTAEGIARPKLRTNVRE